MASEPPHTYSAFISYSRKDEVFVTRLLKQLERYRIPRSFRTNGGKFRIFRDTEDAGVGELTDVLRKALDASDYLIIVCSPDARRSNFVALEIDYFANTKGPNSIIPILVAGRPNVEVTNENELQDKAIPDALYKHFEEPLAADFRSKEGDGFFTKRQRAREARFQVIAKLLGTEKTEKLVRRHQWRRLAILSLTIMVLLGAAGATGSAAWMAKEGVTVQYAGSIVLARLHLIDVLEPEMVSIPGGTFQQGDVNGRGGTTEKPLRPVTLNSFAMGKFEVTFEEYDQYVESTGRRRPEDYGWGREGRPVINVSWEEAVAYSKWLSKATGKHYRLPTESEWEYAARSRDKDDIWSGTSVGERIKDYVVYKASRTETVGENLGRKPNALGLYDMSGNVWEWVEDCWHDNYEGAPHDGLAWLQAHGSVCLRRVIRGGSWRHINLEILRTSERYRSNPIDHFTDVGFRLAQDIE